jgi:hypothetical protein
MSEGYFGKLLRLGAEIARNVKTSAAKAAKWQRKRPKRKRLGKFFFLSPALQGKPHCLELQDKADFLLPGRVLLGPEEFGRYGLPKLPRAPQLRPEQGQDCAPPKDFEWYDQCFLVSQRMKDALQNVDPDAVEFAECDVYYKSGKPIEVKHYLCDIVREIDALDERRSDVRIRRIDGRKFYDVLGSKRIIFDENIVGNSHIFRQKHLPGIVCDAKIRDACIAAGIRNPLYFEDVSVL